MGVGLAWSDGVESGPIMADWLTVREAALQLGNVSTKLIYKMYHRGDLDGAKIAGTVRIRAASVAAYLDAHRNRRPAPIGGAEELPEQPPPTRRRRHPGSDDFISYYRREMDRIERK